MKICPACSREHGDEHETCIDDGVVLVRLDQGVNERAQDLIGKVVDGRYRVERIVGRGGMGTVYACRHVVVGKPFAMKVLRPGIERSEEILQRFIREAQAANAVQSRHICEMTDFGQLSSGAFYVVMELLDGMSLTRALREKRLDRRALKHVFIQVAETLDRAHKASIIHRDLKPDNVVLVHDEGDPHFVKLVDFGIAKMVQSKASSLTETGVILGTPYYMSPEQARGDELDHRSDIYAAGVMMYRAFTGRLPFVADTAMGVLTRHLTEKPELPSRLTEIDSALERLILRCLEKKPIDRYQTMADVAQALRTIPDSVRVRTEYETFDERSGSSALQPVAPPGSRGDTAHPGQDPPSVHSDPHPTPTRLATPYAKSQRRAAWEPHTGANPAVTGRAEAASAPVPRSNPPPRPRSNPPASAGPTIPRLAAAPRIEPGPRLEPGMGPMPLPQVPISQRPRPPAAPTPLAGTPMHTPPPAAALSPGAAAAAYAAHVAQYPVHTPEHGMPSGMMPAASHISSGSHQVPSGVHPVHRPVSTPAYYPQGTTGTPHTGGALPPMMPAPPLDGVAASPHTEAATNRGLSARISIRPQRSHRVAIIGVMVAVALTAATAVTILLVVRGDRGSAGSPSADPAETGNRQAAQPSTAPAPIPAPSAAVDPPEASTSPTTDPSTDPSSSDPSGAGSASKRSPRQKGQPKPDPDDGGKVQPGDSVDDVRDPFSK